MHNIAIGPDDSVYISDSWNHCIRKIDANGQITTIAGTGMPGFSGDGGQASKAEFNYIMCITLNPKGDKLHIADLKNRRIHEMDLNSGSVKTIAGNGNRGIPKTARWLPRPRWSIRVQFAVTRPGMFMCLSAEVMPSASFAWTEKFKPLRATETKGAPMALVQ